MAVTDPDAKPLSAVQEIDDARLRRHGVRLWLKRDDLLDARVPGNKWRKLRHNLSAARADGHDTLVTFGGAYSHHIAATAAAGRRDGFSTVGVIRGEERLPLNPILAGARADGMRLTYLDRSSYRRKTEPEILDRLRARYGRCYVIPEGGSNPAGVMGCRELGTELIGQLKPDLVWCPVGSGGTLAGLAAGVDGTPTTGVCVLRGDGFMDGAVERLQVDAFGRRLGTWRVLYGHHHGGYAKVSAELDDFIDEFRVRHGVALEPIYVAKSLYALYRHVDEGRIAVGSRVVTIVTGPRLQASPRSSRSNSREAR